MVATLSGEHAWRWCRWRLWGGGLVVFCGRDKCLGEFNGLCWGHDRPCLGGGVEQ